MWLADSAKMGDRLPCWLEQAATRPPLTLMSLSRHILWCWLPTTNCDTTSAFAVRFPCDELNEIVEIQVEGDVMLRRYVVKIEFFNMWKLWQGPVPPQETFVSIGGLPSLIYSKMLHRLPSRRRLRTSRISLESDCRLKLRYFKILIWLEHFLMGSSLNPYIALQWVHYFWIADYE